ARGIHEFQSALDVGGRVGDRIAGDPGLRRNADRGREPVAHEVAEFLRDVMGVDVADHLAVPPLPNCTFWNSLVGNVREQLLVCWLRDVLPRLRLTMRIEPS